MPVRDILELIIKSTHTGDGEKKAAKGIQTVVKAAAALGSALAVKQVAEYAVELGKIGIQAQATGQRFEAFAGGTEQSTIFLEAFNKGAQGTVDRLTAMGSASQLLQMGLVGTSNEMEQIAAMATRLGDQSQDAGSRVSDFALMLANTSMPRLDAYGLSAGRVRAKMQELQMTGQAVGREEAFKMAVMLEGASALETLGDTTETTAHKIDTAKAAWADMKTSMGEVILAAGETTGALEGIPRRLRGIADMYRAVSENGVSAQGVFAAWGSVLDKNTTMTEAYTRALGGVNSELVTAKQKHELLRGAIEPERQAITSLSYASDELKEKLHGQIESQGSMMHTVLATADAIRREGVGSNSALEGAIIAANDAAKLSPEAYAAQAEAARGAATATAGLASSLKDATDAQIAQAAIAQLGQALAEGEITTETYATAVQETQLAFGLADAQSIALTGSLSLLTEALASGNLKATDYNEALTTAIAQSAAAGVEANAFASALAGIPDKKVVTLEYNIITHGSPPGGAGGGTQGGDAQALGTGFAMGGTTLVGERGPELVNLPRGSQVFSAGQTRGMMRGGGGSTSITNHFHISNPDPAVVVRQIERYMRIKNKSSGPVMGR